MRKLISVSISVPMKLRNIYIEREKVFIKNYVEIVWGKTLLWFSIKNNLFLIL